MEANNQNKKNQAYIDSIPEEKSEIHETEINENGEEISSKKTISKKAALLAGGGSLLAFNLGSSSGNANPSEIMIDKNQDNIADAIISDANNDGIYETETNIENKSSNQIWDPHTAPLVGGDVVNDNMSFSEAFAAARQEVGAGGVFQWHGQSYGTFYENEVDENFQPTVEVNTVDYHEMPSNEQHQQTENIVDENSISDTENVQTVEVVDETSTVENSTQSNTSASVEPNVIGVDLNQDGNADAIFVDVNLDGSADAVISDLNVDGTIGDDEIEYIHDVNTLDYSGNQTDGSVMTADLNADGISDLQMTDANSDNMAEKVEGMNGFNSSATIEYDGEISTEMPEDVPDSILDQNTDEMSSMDDNFTDLNNWV